ncbi:MAG: YkvA family protein [Kiritimatiellae bacterium]|nr:YkvA family protein [Kiritimatiellia bacterium]
MEEHDVFDYSKAYNEKSLWEKIGSFALAAGKGTIKKVLILYYCLQDPDTPAWAKATIIGALGYFILPLDAIPDFIPSVGYVDDLGGLAVATGAVLMHIKIAHRTLAKAKLSQWFGDQA